MGVSGAGAASTTVTEKSNATYGTILADGASKTLYTLTNNGSPVLCSGVCAQIWPPLTVPPGTTVTGPSGVCCLGTTTNANGEAVTYKGDPLYRYANDSTPTDATGEGITSFGGTWHVVRVSSSTPSTTAPPATTTTTTAPAAPATPHAGAPTATTTATTTTTAPPAATRATPATSATSTAATGAQAVTAAAASGLTAGAIPRGSPGTGGTPPRSSGPALPIGIGAAVVGVTLVATTRRRGRRGS